MEKLRHFLTAEIIWIESSYTQIWTSCGGNLVTIQKALPSNSQTIFWHVSHFAVSRHSNHCWFYCCWQHSRKIFTSWLLCSLFPTFPFDRLPLIKLVNNSSKILSQNFFPALLFYPDPDPFLSPYLLSLYNLKSRGVICK